MARRRKKISTLAFVPRSKKISEKKYQEGKNPYDWEVEKYPYYTEFLIDAVFDVVGYGWRERMEVEKIPRVVGTFSRKTRKELEEMALKEFHKRLLKEWADAHGMDYYEAREMYNRGEIDIDIMDIKIIPIRVWKGST